MSFYQTMISQVTGVTDKAELEEIEEIMRGESDGTLNSLDKAEFTALAKDAKEAFDQIQKVEIEL